MIKQIRTGIIGAAGFTGRELMRLINDHLNFSLEYVTSSEYAGRRVGEAFGELDLGRVGKVLFSGHPGGAGDVPELDVVFLAVPDEAAMRWAPELLAKGVRVIDISGSFRLKDVADFTSYYKIEHTAAQLLGEAVYGMTEMYRQQIAEARLLANPGCYATSVVLPLYFLRSLVAECEARFIVDAKSGSSGAGGRAEKDGLPYSKVAENFRAYKVKAHQHIPEIVQAVAPFFSEPPVIRMTPHLLPLFRGILSVIYLLPKNGVNLKGAAESALESAAKEVEGEPFIRLLSSPEEVELRRVQNTNFLDFAFHYDEAANMGVVISAIDNLGKGAAGQAIQNANVMFGLSETAGLL